MLSKTLWATTLCLTVFTPAIARAQDMPIAETDPSVWSVQTVAAPSAASAASFTQLSAAPQKSNVAAASVQKPDRPAFLLPLAGLAALLFVAQRHSHTRDRSTTTRKPQRPTPATGFGGLSADAS